MHHIELAVSFSQPSCLVIAGWAIRDEKHAEVEVLSTLSGWDARALASCRWHARLDVEGHDGLPSGFCAIVDIEPERLNGPLYLAFRCRDGRRLLGSAIDPLRYHAGMRAALRGLFAAHRGLVPPERVMAKPRPMELLGVVAAPPHEFSESAAMWVEHTVPLPDQSTLVSGWCYAEKGFRSLELLDADGHTLSDVLTEGIFVPRADVAAYVQGRPHADADHGFAVRVAAREPDGRGPVMLCGHTNDGKLFGLDLCAVTGQTDEETAERLISAVPGRIHGEGELMARCLGPALFALKHRPHASDLAFRERIYGTAARQPDLAIVVAAEQDPAWLRYQLSALSGSRGLDECELSYVVSDPAMEAVLSRTAEDIAQHFGVPFRLLVATEKVAPPSAINAAVRAVSAPHLLLLGGRVLPRSTSSLSTLRAAYAGLSAACAVGPKLVTAEGTLESAPAALGTSDPKDVLGSLSVQGPPEALVDFAGPIAVESLSSSCLLTERELFIRAGGVASDFWQFRAADVDLCERLKRRSGRQLYFVPDSTMDDLKAAPEPAWLGTAGSRLDQYDRWLLERRRAQQGLH